MPPGGYVEIPHNTPYALILANKRTVRADAHIEIDGKEIGTWRLNAGDTFRLERPANDTGRFTFYKVGTAEAQAAQLSESDPRLGLVKVTFTPERTPRPLRADVNIVLRGQTYPTYSSPTFTSTNDAPVSMTTKSMFQSAGGTGSSGESAQQFISVAALDYDYSQQTVIHLRLVARNGQEPRPLTSFSTPVPPPVR